MVELRVSVANGYAVQRLWQALWWITAQALRIQEQTLPYTVNTYSSFEKWPLAYYRDLDQNKDLTTGYQIILCPECPLWILYCLGVHSRTPLSHGSNVCVIGPGRLWKLSCIRSGPNTQGPRAHHPFTQPAPVASCGVPYDWLTDNEKPRLCLQRVAAQCTGTRPLWTDTALQPSSRTVLETLVEILPAGRTWTHIPGCSFCLEGEVIHHLICELKWMVRLNC